MINEAANLLVSYTLNVFVNADRFAVSERVQDVLRVFQLFHRKNNLILDEVSLPLQILHSLLQEQTLVYILSGQHVFWVLRIVKFLILTRISLRPSALTSFWLLAFFSVLSACLSKSSNSLSLVS